MVTDEEETPRTPRGGKGVIFVSEHPTTLEPLGGPRRLVLPARRRATGVGSLTCVGQTRPAGESISLRDGKDAWGLEHTPTLHRHLTLACNSRHHSEHCPRKRHRGSKAETPLDLTLHPLIKTTHTLFQVVVETVCGERNPDVHSATLFVGSLRFWNAKMQSR